MHSENHMYIYIYIYIGTIQAPLSVIKNSYLVLLN